MTFAEHLAQTRDVRKARVAYARERRWRGDEWYDAWKTTDLRHEVEAAVRDVLTPAVAGGNNAACPTSDSARSTSSTT